jgi:hypothetical protein
MPKRVSPFRLVAEDTVNVVSFGPRYGTPLDDTTLLGIEHRTLGAYTGILLERPEFHALAEWLAAEVFDDPEVLAPFVRPTSEDGVPRYVRRIEQTPSQFRIIDLQTAMMITRRPGFRTKLTTWWLGSGRGRTAVLDDVADRLFTEWATDADIKGWIGWKSHA